LGKRVKLQELNALGMTDSETRYLYDGLLPIEHLDASNATTLTVTRGLDLSGSLQSAGGIGGILATTDYSLLSSVYFNFDANGNVTHLIDDTDNVVAHYEYDPFGNKIVNEGPLADANPYQWSSKESHAKSGLVYYLYRCYAPELGRWVSRDPIEEEGGENLYVFVVNDPCAYVDPAGEMSFKDIAFSSVGWDKSGNIPPGGQGFPIGLGGARIQVIWYFTGSYFGCCSQKTGKKEHWFSGTLGIEAYVIWGYAGKKPGWDGKGRDRNKRGPDGVKNKNRGPSDRPVGAFRERSWHVDFSGVDPCPDQTWTGSVYIFVRGSAGAYVGGQFNVQRTWTFNDGVSGSDFDFSAHTAKGIYGVSVEVGGGGSITGKAPVPGVN
jgi:RHS repeat-associated protein